MRNVKKEEEEENERVTEKLRAYFSRHFFLFYIYIYMLSIEKCISNRVAYVNTKYFISFSFGPLLFV